jgi:methylated-DNA-[protein]-cysteine S-methyltransferase
MARSAVQIDSPVGPLRLVTDAGSLVELELPPPREEAPPPPTQPADRELLDEAAAQLADYFAGRRTDFELPLALDGTDFQRRVWAELCQIPYGDTISYGQLALRVGKPGSARAVGLANGRNPVAIIVPCHRVIGSDGKLTGYGGGLDRKAWLLDHEAAHGPGQLALAPPARLGA